MGTTRRGAPPLPGSPEEEALIRREFPQLQIDTDDDVERYFEFRKDGRQLDALSVYRGKIVPKYPDPERRVAILRAYRLRDGNYRPLVRQAMMELARRMVERAKQEIASITRPVDGLNLRNTYSTMVAVETIISRLPEDRSMAMDRLERGLRLALAFGYRVREMERAYDLVREYLYETDSEETLEEAIERGREEREREREARDRASRPKYFDLSRMSFSQSDLARILVPEGLERREDRILAYCYKYWLQVDDPSFERTVFLYSRKNRTSHYAAFHAIKSGRQQRRSDEEILNAVSGAVTTGYSYSVQGDIYLQEAWRRLKERLYAASLPLLPAPAAAEQDDRPKGAKLTVAAAKSERAAKSRDAAAGKKAKLRERRRKSAEEKIARGEARKADRAALAEARRAARGAGSRRAKADAPPAARSGGPSISDMVKELSGRSYDVYRDNFLKRARSHIRAGLQERASRHRSIFDGGLNEAEEAVYSFIETNYDNPFLDWKGSEERRKVEELGYQLASLAEIVERCYRSL